MSIELSREELKHYRIVAPQMAPLQFKFIEAVLQEAGYQVEIVPAVTKEMVDWALRYVNNDMCYPAHLAIGQVCYTAIKAAEAHPNEKVAIIITQTGGGCRASQYYGAIIKAMRDCGYGDVPVIPLSFVPIKGEKFNVLGIKLSQVVQAAYGCILGDLLMVLGDHYRPYERQPGSVDTLIDQKVTELRTAKFSNMDKKVFMQRIDEILDDFSQLPLATPLGSKPRIGVVGEILLKYHPDGNNHLVKFIEENDCEAVVSPLVDFFLYCMTGPVFQSKRLGRSKLKAAGTRLMISFLEKYKQIVNQKLIQHGLSDLIWPSIWELSAKIDDIIPPESSMGEGWLLPAEAVDAIQHGTRHIVIAQPFACLPNHQIGAGTAKTIQDKYPGAEVLSVDYDASASTTNQQNRIKLLITAAKEDFAAQKSSTLTEGGR